ncbi:DEAD/DEAH box helicase [Methyloglobulus sp.]|uniref:DEAD/DEAH box helicase n=1 Tax=Methyloglobulus sp. TaxID=2518622 RepID=UPI003988F787
MQIPNATSSFSGFGLDNRMLLAIDKLGFETPTPVQQQAIPAVLDRKDCLVSAETGSGKTAAYLLPTLQHLLASTAKPLGIQALILCPTRELAQQIFGQCQQFSEFTPLKTGLITGGSDFKKQQAALTHNANIIVATPGRLLEHFQLSTAYFQQLSLLILDEADRMLDMGFSDDVLKIVEQCNKQRQTLLFSATLTHFGVIKIADKVLKNPKVVALNTLHDVHSNITQHLILADDHDHKLKLLANLLTHKSFDKALVFTNTRLRADELHNSVRGAGLRSGLLHGDMDQKDRNRIMALYRDGTINTLIATDLAARGLDIKGINLVINFDIPRNGIDYIHRIGRTGRADELGVSIALVKSTEWNLMAGIERFLKQKFIRRTIKELEGSYKGPKKLKTSGKAAGSKDKNEPAKKAVVKKIKVRERDKKNVGKRRVPSEKPATE